MNNQDNFHLRPFVTTDVQKVVDIINAAAAHNGLGPQAVVDSVGNLRLARYNPGNSEKVVILDPLEAIVGFAYLANRDHFIVLEAGCAVHPKMLGRGIGTLLRHWSEQQAYLLSSQAPGTARIVLQINLFETEKEAVSLYAQAGYERIREWLHLTITLDRPPVVPPLPSGLTLREMDLEKDWGIVGPAMEAAYADHWGVISPAPEAETTPSMSEPEPAVEDDESYSNSAGHCFLVIDQQRVLGGVLCNAKLVERGDAGRVGSLFVIPEARRQGLARILMLRSFDAFWQQGIRTIITDTDAESFSKAPRFYTSLGMKEYRREGLIEKEIRAGMELRRMSQ